MDLKFKVSVTDDYHKSDIKQADDACVLQQICHLFFYHHWWFNEERGTIFQSISTSFTIVSPVDDIFRDQDVLLRKRIARRKAYLVHTVG